MPTSIAPATAPSGSAKVASPVGVPLQGSLVPGGSGAMFDSIAARYDLMNRLMTFGIDQRWRRQVVDLLQLSGSSRVLDLATGTADLALLVAQRLPQAKVVGLDPSTNMLSIGMAKVRKAGAEGRIELVHGDACQLPFEDGSFDGITMGYGIRNVTDIPKALREAHRVLRYGGRFFCLEFSTVEWPGLAQIYDVYSDKLVPKLGKAIAGDEDSYRYLVESIRRFPDMQNFKRMIGEAGFVQTKVEPILGGLVAIHSGWKV